MSSPVFRLYQVKYEGRTFIGPQLKSVLAHINAGIPDASMRLTPTCMSLAVRGMLKRGYHKGASGTILHVDHTFTVPEGATWVGGV